MTQAFLRTGVIKYDHEFRKLQAEYGLSWNTDNIYLMQLFFKGKLKPEYPSSTWQFPSSSTNIRARSNRFYPNSDKIICKKFNGRNGCIVSQCKYAHVCFACYAPNHEDVNHKDHVVCTLAVVPKPDSDIRLIHDCRRPIGSSLIDYVSKESFSHQRFNEAVDYVQLNWYTANVDLKPAYRPVPIHPSNYKFTGIKWQFSNSSVKYLYDTRLPFESRKSPDIFNWITQAVKIMMHRSGFGCIVNSLCVHLMVINI